MTVQNFEVLNTTGKLIEAKSAWFQWDAVETDPDQMKGEFHGYKVWINPQCANRNKSRLLFSSAEMFKKPLLQTAWTQIRLLLLEQSVLGPCCLLLYLICQ